MKKLILLFILFGCAQGPSRIQKQEVSSKCNQKSCSQMSTCAEAMYNFLSCGRQELDKDDDGEPCDFLCDERL